MLGPWPRARVPVARWPADLAAMTVEIRDVAPGLCWIGRKAVTLVKAAPIWSTRCFAARAGRSARSVASPKQSQKHSAFRRTLCVDFS